MKRIACIWLSGAILAGLMVTLAAAQSSDDNLAEYARQLRKQKQSDPATKKVYDEGNLPREEHISVVGTPTAQSATAAAQPGEAGSQGTPDGEQVNTAGQANANDQAAAPTAITPGESPEERQQVYDGWKKKIAEQKQKIDLLARELDVVQREYRLRAAAEYADAGNRLRNAAAWDKEDAQYKQQIEAKQKALDAAKQQLSDLQEQARKAGVPAKVRE
jgi:hypothetical protein